MAANNYFGFTQGTNQYRAATFAAAAAVPQYGVARAAPAASAYGSTATFQPIMADAAAAGYAVAAQPVAAPAFDYSATAYQRAPPSYSVDSGSVKQTFYQQPAATAYQCHADVFSAVNKVSTAYQPTYQTVAPVTKAESSVSSQVSTGAGYADQYHNQTRSYWQKSSVSGGFDAVRAASASATTLAQTGVGSFSRDTRSWRPQRPGFGSAVRTKPFNKMRSSEQLHYCDVCRISCAGPQTYREHLEGQKHKKREAAMKSQAVVSSRQGKSLRCELCDVVCTGSDAYAAHVRGTKHVKVVKLHTKLGKPIPSSDPTLLTPEVETDKSKDTVKASDTTDEPLPTDINKQPPSKSEAVEVPVNRDNGTTKAKDSEHEDLRAAAAAALGEKEVEPVGQEYIEVIKNDEGKIISFNCKLCDCRFNDPNADQMHMKGRRHRLQYKKKVNPGLSVELKPGVRQRRQLERARRTKLAREVAEVDDGVIGDLMASRPALPPVRGQHPMMMMGDADWSRRGPMPHPPFLPPSPFRFPMPPDMMRRAETLDDRTVMAKHSCIYPPEESLAKTQTIISAVERALKLVSDEIADSDAPKSQHDKASVGAKKECRILKGVMRVGILAKGLLLRTDRHVQLVVLCSDKPTRSLLERVAGSIPKHITAASEDHTFSLKLCVEAASLILVSEPDSFEVTVTLTSSLIRSTPATGETATPGKDAPDVLDKQQCLQALAALRHAKWFQARATSLQSCVIVTRIMRDYLHRVPVWSVLTDWALEVLVERVLASAGRPLMPGEAFRRLLEAISSGILLPGSPGILDPCEKEPQDVLVCLKPQQREDITASAQQALRQMAFRKLHKVLDVEPLVSKGAVDTSGSQTAGASSECAGESAVGDTTSSEEPKIKRIKSE